MNCIKKYNDSDSNNTKVCDNCMQSYLKLDNYYKTLSADAIGVDSICMDIVDSVSWTKIKAPYKSHNTTAIYPQINIACYNTSHSAAIGEAL